ncbi:MerR family transcriptional regulator [Legionella pneumophila serogroup 1]|uniref:MerR family transcriptional regulator n=1 Tax=Legionella pneumophila TaxID=446 RepID=UPI0007708B11|nr:MerR family transcriptional regulator [Legionella pneumophila]HAT8713226.1 MerR family transcriptional regulator [Legionella jordanis]HAT8862493.1 MerR family transcriptional regulator [Legionella pneumophila subsp. pneumophila]MDI9825834.1 MerR family transcriptional regulator [Legionella pneumophila]MDW8896962.1 MerR family transcriptional regulator [Legionella pneumophila]CZH50736.1 Multidrug transporter activation protein [Legionella pneumophila]
MTYTVKQLAKISGVSVRTLHWYDEIGLLKPAYQGANGYRYYEEKQCLRLQQVLFFRELGFPLNEIQKLLMQDDFDHIKALRAHKQVLESEINRKNKLITTIDKTIQHLRGKHKMSNEELYYGFDSEKQKQYEKELVKEGVVSQEWMNNYKKKINKWTQEDKEKFIQEGKEINEALILAINKKLNPSSPEVQAIIGKHHTWVGWNPTKEGYIGLSQRYLTPEFRKFYEQLHPELVDFIVEAMSLYANKNL